MFNAIGAFFKIVLFLFRLKGESNKTKAKEKAAIGKELIDALAETNKHLRASLLSSVVVKLRK